MEYHEVPEQFIELQIMEKANCGYALGCVWGIEKRRGWAVKLEWHLAARLCNLIVLP